MLPQSTRDAIASRLAALSDLRLPAQLRKEGSRPTVQKKIDYLSALLLHDPGVFLERHGEQLTAEERREFECLRGDYEVNYYLQLLEDRQDGAKQQQVAKNRRHAYMNRLEAEGSYFSEKEMRDRQPGLYHQFIGQYRPPELPQAGGDCQAGCVLADSIMAQQEELDLRQRQREEQQRWEQQEGESESESEDGENEETAGRQGGAAAGEQRQAAAAAPAAAPQQGEAGSDRGGGEQQEEGGAGGAEEEGPAYIRISEAEQQENSTAFLDAMRQRFLSGQDAGVDYAAIDADAELDEDWAVQAGRDAEDKYFE